MAEPQTFADLVDLAMQRHQATSYRQLEQISRDADRLISHTTLSQMHQGSYTSATTKERRERLAWLAGVHPRVAHQIAGKVSAPFDLPDDADELTGDQREAVLAVVRSFVKANRSRPQLRAVEAVDPPDEHPEYERAARKRQRGVPPTQRHLTEAHLDAAGEESQATDDGG